MRFFGGEFVRRLLNIAEDTEMIGMSASFASVLPVSRVQQHFSFSHIMANESGLRSIIEQMTRAS